MQSRKIIWLLVLLTPLCAAAQAPRAVTGAVVESWKYDAETKAVSLKMVNRSTKDITAYNVAIIMTYADGSTDALPNGVASHERGEENLGSIIYAEMEKGPVNEEFSRRFAPGAVRYDILPQTKDVADVKAVFDMVIYSDCTAEVLNERAFTQAIAMRKGNVLAMKKVSEVIKQVLDDPTLTNPSVAAKTELTRLALASVGKQHTPEDPDGQLQIQLQNALSALNNTPKQSERDYLTKYVEDNDKRIALMEPHTQITKISNSNP